MALSTRLPSGIDNAGFIPEQWAIDVLDIIKTKLVIASTFDMTWTIGKGKGDTVNVGILNEPTAREVTVGTPGVTNDIATGTKLQIVMNQWYEAPVVVDNMTDLQSQVDLVLKGKDASAYAIAKKIDYICGGYFSALYGSSGYGTDGVAIDDNVLISAVEKLDEADAPDEGRVWVLDPSSKADIMKIDKFTRLDYGAGDAVVTGMFRKNVYGAPVLISNNLTVGTTGNIGAYYQKRALAIAIQEDMLAYVVPEPLKHIKTVNTEALWGCLEMRDTFGLPILTRKS